jgi:two-component system OmpR family sensor kinase
MNSIRRNLLLWLSAGLSACVLVAAGLLYFQARNEANQLFDYQMKQLAASLPDQAFAPLAPERAERLAREEDIVIQIWDNTGLRIYRSHRQMELPQRAELGFSDITVDGNRWRVYSTQLGDTVVQIAQPFGARSQIAARMALKTAALLLLLLPFLGGIIWLTVGRGLAPLRRLATEVEARDAASLQAISDAGLPQEIRPLTAALNDLLARLGHSMQAQRAFVADAAHELRTPLGALKLQLQLAERAATPAERQETFADLKRGLERAIHLVQQLLTLARQEPGVLEQPPQLVDLVQLAHNVVADFALKADARHIDLGIGRETPAVVKGNSDALRILLNNLVDNALRYTPPHGRVDVSVQAEAGAVALIVEDTGPGIPELELERVFDRFYRADSGSANGSGLGLAIVRQIALSHGAEASAANTGHGLRVCVRFPRRV